jgi:response regulator NasT
VLRAILVVDPDADYRSWLGSILTGNGSRVVGETDQADEAMHLAATTTPDVAVVAADLGQADGIRLADRLAREHGVPTVILGAGTDAEVVARAAQLGAMGFLFKPVDPASLRATLEVAASRFQEMLSLQREVETARRALQDRKIIERAKGVLMEMEGISEGEAYARIRQKSMDTQRPMAEICRAIILTAEVSGRSR